MTPIAKDGIGIAAFVPRSVRAGTRLIDKYRRAAWMVVSILIRERIRLAGHPRPSPGTPRPPWFPPIVGAYYRLQDDLR